MAESGADKKTTRSFAMTDANAAVSYNTAASDEEWMRIACAEARKSLPVPTAYCVGCVIAQNGKALSTGYSRELPGNTHAEECAIRKLIDNKQDSNITLSQATLYTTMEPCSKRLSGNTPCVAHILDAKIPRVVIGAMEPDTFVNCEGVRILQEANVEVSLLKGLEGECLAPNAHILQQ